MSGQSGSRHRGFLVEGPHRFGVADLPTPSPGPGEVLVRSRAAGICRTDFEIVEGLLPSDWIQYPVVIGHEWCGMVAAVGSGVTGLAPGDRVVSEGMIPCHRCENCRKGKTNICLNYDQLGFTRGGGCAEYVLTPARVVHRVPDTLDFTAGALIEPASCVIHGFMRGGPSPGATVAVVGPGTLGLIAVMAARLWSAERIILLGVNNRTLDLGRSLGATDVVNVTAVDPVTAVRELTRGLGADFVFEAAGHPGAVRQALEVVRIGGRVVLEGITGGNRTLEVPSDLFMSKDLQVHGIYSYTSAAFQETVRLASQSRLPLQELVANRVPLEGISGVFDLMSRGENVGKTVVLP